MKSVKISVILIVLSTLVYAQDKTAKKFNLYPQDEKEYGYGRFNPLMQLLGLS